MRRAIALVWLGLALASPAVAQRPAGDVISYQTDACFGRCPVYRVIVWPNGAGQFEGLRFTAVQGRRRFRVTAAQYRAFAARLAPYRPNGVEEIAPGHRRCRQEATDNPSAIVIWARSERADTLRFYFGCHDAANAALARALREAPGLLPIGALIGAAR